MCLDSSTWNRSSFLLSVPSLFFARLRSYFVPKAFLPVILTLASAVQRQLCVKGPGGVVQTPLCQDPVYTVTQVIYL